MAKSIRTIISKLGSACSSSMERRRSVKMPMRYADSASGAERVEAIANSQHSTDPILRFHTIIIQILHQTTTTWRFPPPRWCCILSKIYIKPQPAEMTDSSSKGCILSKIYIKPQRPRRRLRRHAGCILSKIYIKPQLIWYDTTIIQVVSYQKSTSNHNNGCRWSYICHVVSYQKSTSNHNKVATRQPRSLGCILSKIYIKPQLYISVRIKVRSCILSKIYIKPQLHSVNQLRYMRCILSKIYIKPQPTVYAFRRKDGLYLIKNLHQTTTPQE